MVPDELDMGTAPYARSQIHGGLIQRPQRLTIDLSDVRFMGSAGLGLLVEAREDAEHTGVKLSLAGVQDNRIVRRALEVSGLYELFDIA